jgi:prevent-host-death family protein
MADGTWSVAEAKAKFSELVEKARNQGPQRVTRHGKAAVMVVSTDEWAKRTNLSKPDDTTEAPDAPKTLYEFFERSPLRGSGVRFERMKGKMRDLEY